MATETMTAPTRVVETFKQQYQRQGAWTKGLIGAIHVPEGAQLEVSKPQDIEDIVFEFKTREEGIYVLSLPTKLAPKALQQLQRLEGQGAFR
jgi:hypothetical protein